MERTRQEKSQSTRRHGLRRQTPDALPPQPDPLRVRQDMQAATPAQLLALQRQVGNQAAIRRLQGETALQREVSYNAALDEQGREIDPELAAGVLPFTETGWDGRLIAQKLSQLNPLSPPSDAVRCAQTSFLVVLVQRGPEAVLEVIEHTLQRYAEKLRSPRTRPALRKVYEWGVEHLTPLPEKINGKSATFDDLSHLQQAMFEEYAGAEGAAAGGTTLEDIRKMIQSEGYTARALSLRDIAQDKAAEQAAQLKPGEFLDCSVDNTPLGIYVYNHSVHIGAYPDTGGLYLYDPAPIHGSQLVDLDTSLNAMQHYFINSDEAIRAELGAVEGMTISVPRPGGSTGAAAPPAAQEAPPSAEYSEAEMEGMRKRKFMINTRYTPPEPAEAQQ